MAELSAEMNEQGTNGQADPRYWVIMDTRWVLAAEGSGEEFHVLCDDEEYELNEFAEKLIENHEHDEKREEEIEEAFALCDSTDELRGLANN